MQKEKGDEKLREDVLEIIDNCESYGLGRSEAMVVMVDSIRRKAYEEYADRLSELGDGEE